MEITKPVLGTQAENLSGAWKVTDYLPPAATGAVLWMGPHRKWLIGAIVEARGYSIQLGYDMMLLCTY
jgi:hypothetical protein